MEMEYNYLKTRQLEYLDQIMRNREAYNDFLAFAEQKLFCGELVRFLRTMTEIPWNGNTPLSVNMNRGVYSTYIRPESLYEVNLSNQLRQGIKGPLDREEEVDWGPAVAEVKRLLVNNEAVYKYMKYRVSQLHDD
jgi:hypothetical protein